MTPAYRTLRNRLALTAAFFAMCWLLAMTTRDSPIYWNAAMRGLFAGMPALFVSTWFAVRRAYRGNPVDQAKETAVPIVIFISLFVLAGWIT